VDRRRLLVGLGALAVVPQMTWAKDYIDLDWGDLMPEGQAASTPVLQGVIQHDQAPLVNQQPQSQGVRTEWNGNVVRLPGFIVPIDFSGTGVTAFILVPFVGACIHVPPPPANQLVLVTTERPYESSGLFEPVKVTGMFGVSSISTHLADIGYALSADRIERYRS
ncbi:MAG: DUF3299 domain-containing protein, partial [Pseudomonadota bacterium]